MNTNTINLTPPRLQDAPRFVDPNAGWNKPLILRAMRAIGAGLFVFAVMWLWKEPEFATRIVTIAGVSNPIEVRDPWRPHIQLHLIAAVGAAFFAAGIPHTSLRWSGSDRETR